MYEIWLTLNILYELGLQYLPVVIGTALLWLVLMAVAAARGRAGWGAALKPAIAIALVVAAITFFVTPGMTQSSLGFGEQWNQKPT